MTAATVNGVVAPAKGAPVEVREIVVPDPGPGEVRVTVQACGVCHTDLHYREGAINDEFPFLLGHEAAGIVESVGPDVTDVAPGDFVILNWRAVCGTCRACRRGRPWYCFSTFNATQKMTLTDGTPLTPALGIGAFAEQTLVAAGQATKVDPRARPEAAGLLGLRRDGRARARRCTRATSAGATASRSSGAAASATRPSPGARSRAPTRSSRSTSTPGSSTWAEEFGATHTVNSRETDPVEAIRALTDGNGADVCIEAVGRPEVLEQAFYARDLAGTVVQVGVPDPTMQHRAADDRVLRPRWRAQAVVVRRLPAVTRLPDADRPLPVGTTRPRPVRERDHHARRGRGRVPQDGTRRGAALGRRHLRNRSRGRAKRFTTLGRA